MNDSRPHAQLLHELFGADIGLYPAHLATLNLAAREINDEANYPRIARTDFFDVAADKPFCEIPEAGSSTPSPYHFLNWTPSSETHRMSARKSSEKTLRKSTQNASKPHSQEPAFAGRADIHCYFWPHSAHS